jgi:hypothetical protein
MDEGQYRRKSGCLSDALARLGRVRGIRQPVRLTVLIHDLELGRAEAASRPSGQTSSGFPYRGGATAITGTARASISCGSTIPGPRSRRCRLPEFEPCCPCHFGALSEIEFLAMGLASRMPSVYVGRTHAVREAGQAALRARIAWENSCVDSIGRATPCGSGRHVGDRAGKPAVNIAIPAYRTR